MKQEKVAKIRRHEWLQERRRRRPKRIETPSRVLRTVRTIESNEVVKYRMRVNLAQQQANASANEEVTAELARGEYGSLFSQRKYFLNYLDSIISMLRDFDSQCEALLLVTPCKSKAEHLYRLHVIDTKNGRHLGMFIINNGELSQLRFGSILDNCRLIISQNYISLHSVVSTAMQINNLNPRYSVSTHFCTDMVKCCNCDDSTETPTATTTDANDNLSSTSESDYESDGTYSDLWIYKNQNFSAANDPKLAAVLRRLNEADPQYKTSQADLNIFFELVEIYKIKCFIRPKWYGAKSIDEACHSIECYTVFDRHIGNLTLKHKVLENELAQRPNISVHFKFINDVSEITPFPGWFIKTFRFICVLLRLEYFYDKFCEHAFEFHKKLMKERQFF